MSTGSLVKGTVVGISNGISPQDIVFVDGDPNEVLTASIGSPNSIAFDRTNSTYYLGLGTGTGSTWVKLGSVQ